MKSWHQMQCSVAYGTMERLAALAVITTALAASVAVATVTTSTSTVTYSPAINTTVFTVTYPFISADYLKVTKILKSSGAETTLTRGPDYSVTLAVGATSKVSLSGPMPHFSAIMPHTSSGGPTTASPSRRCSRR